MPYLENINLSGYTPQSVLSNETRSLAGIVKQGEVTFDTDFPMYARFIYVATSGNLSYVQWDGTTGSCPNLVAGVWHPICAKSINSSGTNITADQLRWGA